MRILLTIIALIIAAPAFAISDAQYIYCSRTQQPEQCVKQLAEMEYLQQYLPQQTDRQMTLAEEQTRGMALFGAGFGMINGMNQGFNNMRMPPTPMPQFQPVPMPY